MATPPPTKKRKHEELSVSSTQNPRKYEKVDICPTEVREAAQRHDPNEGRCLLTNALPDVTEACHVMRRDTDTSTVYKKEVD
jgi:hypothetical protein